jgi:hypothetical protein
VQRRHPAPGGADAGLTGLRATGPGITSSSRYARYRRPAGSRRAHSGRPIRTPAAIEPTESQISTTAQQARPPVLSSHGKPVEPAGRYLDATGRVPSAQDAPANLDP